MEQNDKQHQYQLQQPIIMVQNEQNLNNKIKTLDKVKKKMYSRINEFNKKQQELIKQLDDIEKIKKESFKDYLEGFDEQFETYTNDKIKETPLLMKIYSEFIENMFKPSNMYWVAIKTKGMIKEDLLKTLNDEQKDMIEQLQVCEDRILDDMTKQAYVYGYAIAVELREESLKQYPKTEDN